LFFRPPVSRFNKFWAVSLASDKFPDFW